MRTIEMNYGLSDGANKLWMFTKQYQRLPSLYSIRKQIVCLGSVDSCLDFPPFPSPPQIGRVFRSRLIKENYRKRRYNQTKRRQNKTPFYRHDTVRQSVHFATDLVIFYSSFFSSVNLSSQNNIAGSKFAYITTRFTNSVSIFLSFVFRLRYFTIGRSSYG